MGLEKSRGGFSVPVLDSSGGFSDRRGMRTTWVVRATRSLTARRILEARVPRTAVLVLVALFLPTAAQAASPTHVACVGDSITYGYLASSSNASYPSNLQRMLGAAVMVKNFGHSGATMLSVGDLPYQKQSEYTAATSFVSGAGTGSTVAVVIMLGTNDSKPQNWMSGGQTRAAQFRTDAAALVDHFAQMPVHPTVYLAIPPRVYANSFGIDAAVLHDQIEPVLRDVAAAKGVATIDVDTPTAGHPELFSDGVHPTDMGYTRVAMIIHDALLSGGGGGNGGASGGGGGAGGGGAGGGGSGGRGGAAGAMGSGGAGTGGRDGAMGGEPGSGGRTAGGSSGGAGADGAGSGTGGAGSGGANAGGDGMGGGPVATGGVGTGGTPAGSGGRSASGSGGAPASSSGGAPGTGGSQSGGNETNVADGGCACTFAGAEGAGEPGSVALLCLALFLARVRSRRRRGLVSTSVTPQREVRRCGREVPAQREVPETPSMRHLRLPRRRLRLRSRSPWNPRLHRATSGFTVLHCHLRRHRLRWTRCRVAPTISP